MRKQFITVIALALTLTCLFSSASAAGKLAVTQENFYVLNGYSVYGYVFARLENTGDRPVAYSNALLEIYNKDGDTLASDTYPSIYGRYLQPGEYVYMVQNDRIEDIDTYLDVDDYVLTVTGKSGTDYRTIRIDCDNATYTPDLQLSAYSKTNRIECTFTNNTEETLFDLEVVMAVLDADGNILCVESQSLYSGVGVNPGATLTIRASVSEAMREAYERAGLTPDHVDAYAYVEVSD